jgi:MFS family permease
VVESWLGLPPLSGAFVIGAVLLTVTAATAWFRMRPDPLAVAAERRDTAHTTGPAPSPVNLRRALGEIRQVPAARFALAALVLAHVAMVSVMTMTPVSLAMHGHMITIVGITISVHVLGMYAFAPLVGSAADRFGRMPVMFAGQGVLALSAVLNVAAPSSAGVVVVGIFLLGLGWSIVTVPASTMLSQSVPPASRPLVQGAGDSAMNAAAAVGAIGSGAIMVTLGFAWLAGISGALVVPVLWLAVRHSRDARQSLGPQPLRHREV